MALEDSKLTLTSAKVEVEVEAELGNKAITRLRHQGVLNELLAWSGFPAAWQLSRILKVSVSRPWERLLANSSPSQKPRNIS